jgi:hypothetical protein
MQRGCVAIVWYLETGRLCRCEQERKSNNFVTAGDDPSQVDIIFSMLIPQHNLSFGRSRVFKCPLPLSGRQDRRTPSGRTRLPTLITNFVCLGLAIVSQVLLFAPAHGACSCRITISAVVDVRLGVADVLGTLTALRIVHELHQRAVQGMHRERSAYFHGTRSWEH